MGRSSLFFIFYFFRTNACSWFDKIVNYKHFASKQGVLAHSRTHVTCQILIIESVRHIFTENSDEIMQQFLSSGYHKGGHCSCLNGPFTSAVSPLSTPPFGDRDI